MVEYFKLNVAIPENAPDRQYLLNPEQKRTLTELVERLHIEAGVLELPKGRFVPANLVAWYSDLTDSVNLVPNNGRMDSPIFYHIRHPAFFGDLKVIPPAGFELLYNGIVFDFGSRDNKQFVKNSLGL
jgi:hypothetical protein